jgi:hypothetical protein
VAPEGALPVGSVLAVSVGKGLADGCRLGEAPGEALGDAVGLAVTVALGWVAEEHPATRTSIKVATASPILADALISPPFGACTSAGILDSRR